MVSNLLRHLKFLNDMTPYILLGATKQNLDHRFAENSLCLY